MAERKLEKVQDLLTHTADEIRTVIFDLLPAGLDHTGLEPALNRYLARFQETSHPQCSVRVTGGSYRLLPDAALAIYRIIQEALHNARKHSAATKVSVLIDYGPTHLRVIIEDNGKGFDIGKAMGPMQKHLGLVSMRERAQSIDGKIDIESKIGHGTAITVEMPVLGIAYKEGYSPANSNAKPVLGGVAPQQRI